MKHPLLGLSFLACLMTASAWANPILRKLADTPASLCAASADGRWAATAIPANEHRGKPAQAVLYCQERGEKTARWMISLSNPILPEEIHVSDNGHLVTLDNWGEPGEGSEVVALYGPDGRLRKSYALERILTKEEISRRVDSRLFSSPWRNESVSWFTSDGRAWVIRLPWGKVLRFDLDTGEAAAIQETAYVLRQTPTGPALYGVQALDGKQALVPCAGVDLAVEDIFSIRSSARAAGSVCKMEICGAGLTAVKTRYNPVTQEREDVFRATGPGKATLRFTEPRTKFRAEIAASVR